MPVQAAALVNGHGYLEGAAQPGDVLRFIHARCRGDADAVYTEGLHQLRQGDSRVGLQHQQTLPEP